MSALVQVPWCSQFHGAGMEEGPPAVAAALGADGVTTVELDMEAAPEDALAAGLGDIEAAVASAGPDPLVLLGECTLTPAVTAGLRAANPDLVLVWVDAHGDLNTPETSPS
ncbi:MAG TPA: arginase family protein, partial [Gaiellales bacterium]|nr:arginase family protein [Gaiellales bacterium]